MTRPAASTLRRIAALPDRLGPLAAALALLAAVAALLIAGPAPGRAVVADQGCSDMRGVTTVVAHGAPAAAKSAFAKSAFDGADLTAADSGSPADLGPPRASEAVVGSRPAVVASYAEPRQAASADALGGSPHRPPRAA